MKTKPTNTVSVVIPYYNDFENISRCLNSIAQQSQPVSEVIIVDDCSKDSAKLIDFIKNHTEIKYFRNEENVNAAYSRNFGVKKSSCEYIAFLDADDYWENNHIEVNLAACIQNNVDFTYSNVINQSNNRKKFRKVIDHKLYKGECCDILLISAPQTNSFFGRKDMFLNIPFDVDLRRHQDYQLFMDIINSKYTAMYLDSYTSYHCTSSRPLKDRYNINSALKFWEQYEEIVSPDLYSNYLWLSLYICLITFQNPDAVIDKINIREGRKIKKNKTWKVYCYIYFNYKYRLCKLFWGG